MGASAREIEREIRETRERMDENLTRLEGTAASKAARYARWAAVGVGVLAVAGIAFAVYRHTRKPTLRDRLSDASVERLRELLEQIREELPSVTVKVNDRSAREPGTLQTILRKVVPAIIGTASTAVLERIARPAETERRAS
jgi:2,4-dienoyl-CoA reductase-like NADH-dependent reductase (Old Yellow Enzyme family)